MKTKKEAMLLPDIAIPPGETLEETIEAKGMTQRSLRGAWAGRFKS
ncbi:hypothetical protein HZA56_02210 [Candidatus Poribacteria bacterium]|nr:hypothetical protein [Candidatus Poribacteria bacterium]